MRSPALIVFALVALPCCDLSAATRPNVAFIVADDLGYGEPGCFGGKG